MKRYCKDIDITNRKLIKQAVEDCLEDKYSRPDVIRMFAEYTKLTKNHIEDFYKEFGKPSMSIFVDPVIDGIRQELINKTIVIKPIWYTERIDPSSGKARDIGIQDIKQQIYDYIAVYGLKPILKRIGEYQCASIPRRGQLMGAKKIKIWMRNRSIKYGAKLDVKKCFPSIKKRNLMRWLRKLIKNSLLLWLIDKLVSTFKEGLSIGSYLSQYLCNLYMSRLYHKISEDMFHERKQRDGTIKRISLVKHKLFYMDDILILGSNIKYIHKAVKHIISFVKKVMGLTIKETWIAFQVKYTEKKNKKDVDFIDMMGFRIYRWHLTIRRRIFKRIRRAYMRINKYIKKKKKITVSMARRCLSLYGYLKNTDSIKFKRKYHVYELNKVCKKVVREYAKRKVHTKTKPSVYCRVYN